MHVLENSHHSEHRRRIDSLAQSFVIKTDVATGDGDLQLFACFGDAINRLRELPHDVRLLRIAEVQAVRRSYWSRTRTRHLARGLGDRMYRAQSRIEIAPPSIPVERHRKPAL